MPKQYRPWSKDEEIVALYFLSSGVRVAAVCKLIAHKCNRARRNGLDIESHVLKLHQDSEADPYNGFGELLSERAMVPRSVEQIPDGWEIDWRHCWMERNVDGFLVSRASSSRRLEELMRIGRSEEELICEEQEADETGWHWVRKRQNKLVEKRRRDYGD